MSTTFNKQSAGVYEVLDNGVHVGLIVGDEHHTGKARRYWRINIQGASLNQTRTLAEAKAWASNDTPDATPAAAPNPVIMDGIAGILAGTTTPEQVIADVNAILPPRLEQELAAILEETARDWEYDADTIALDDVERMGKPAIGPEFGEMLPKIFNDEIRLRVARQHHAGATIPELAAAWGRTSGSVKKILARFPDGQPASA